MTTRQPYQIDTDYWVWTAFCSEAGWYADVCNVEGETLYLTDYQHTEKMALAAAEKWIDKLKKEE